MRQNIFILCIIFSLLLAVCNTASGQENTPCNTSMTYEDRNQIEMKPVKLRALSGIASDDDGVSIPNVCIGLFSEDTHKIVAVTKTSEDGSFSLDKIAAGRYRLVAKHPVLCTANVPLVLSHGSNKSKRALHLHMRPPGVDRCSFGDLALLRKPPSESSVVTQSSVVATAGGWRVNSTDATNESKERVSARIPDGIMRSSKVGSSSLACPSSTPLWKSPKTP